jgi:hypothetical protein
MKKEKQPSTKVEIESAKAALEQIRLWLKAPLTTEYWTACASKLLPRNRQQ